MKKYFLIIPAAFFALLILVVGCKSKEASQPCDNMGTLCIENKMDSTITINIVQKRQQVTMKKDYMECFALEGNIAYTISITGAGYSKPDTTLLILPCDNKLIVVKE
jgi:hypothetical protein